MEQIVLKCCPVCGKRPRVIRDFGYEINGFGAWCTIRCGSLHKKHLKIEEGKASWDRALYYASLRWNERVDFINRHKRIKPKSQKK